MESVHWEPEDFPDDESWSEFEELRKSHGAKWLIWEDEPSQMTAQKLDDGDFLSVMKQNVANLARIFSNDLSS